MEEKKDKKAIVAIIVTALVCILVIAPLAWYAGKKAAEKDTSTEQKETNKEKEKENNNEGTPASEVKEEEITIEKIPETKKYTIKSVALEEKDPEGKLMIKVEITTTGEALLTHQEYAEEPFENVKIAEDVILALPVHVGQSDICAGNARVMFIHKDKTVSAFYVDDLECGNTIKVKKNVGGLTDIVEIREQIEESESPYEPNNFKVYAVDSNKKMHDISENLS